MQLTNSVNDLFSFERCARLPSLRGTDPHHPRPSVGVSEAGLPEGGLLHAGKLVIEDPVGGEDHRAMGRQETASAPCGSAYWYPVRSARVRCFAMAKGAFGGTGRSQEKPGHAHARSEHVLYILEGQLTVIDGAQNEATAFAEQALYVPAGEVHMAENRGAGRTRYIAVTAPPPA